MLPRTRKTLNLIVWNVKENNLIKKCFAINIVSKESRGLKLKSIRGLHFEGKELAGHIRRKNVYELRHLFQAGRTDTSGMFETQDIKQGFSTGRSRHIFRVAETSFGSPKPNIVDILVAKLYFILL